jgi:polyhydroxybutyrate depolymerase
MTTNKAFIYILLLCFPAIGLSQQLISDSITHDGLNREYILYVPADFSGETAVPLVLNYHGYTASAIIQVAYGDFRPIADTAGFLVVHPLGTKDSFGNTHWNVGWGTSDVDDVGFTTALIDSLSAEWNIDPKRIYSTGMSNGGFMSYKLACELSNRIAAIASVTGTMNKIQTENCYPQGPMPVMEIHGTADSTVPYNGGQWNESIPDVMTYWAEINNCSPDAIITEVPDTNPNDGSTVEHHVYPDGDKGVKIEHFKVIGGGHTWPGTALGGSTTNYDIDASVEIWRFFSRYDINGLIVSSNTNENTECLADAEIYPNPARSSVTIKLKTNAPISFELTSLGGRVLRFGIIEGKSATIDLTDLPDGMLLLRIGTRVHKVFKVN